MTVEPVGDDRGVRVLCAAGDLDVVSAPTVLAQVPGLVAGAEAVVLDTSAVTFFDSSGVHVVDRLARACGAAGAAFRVVAPPGSPTRRVLEMVDMASGLADDDLSSATAAVRRA